MNNNRIFISNLIFKKKGLKLLSLFKKKKDCIFEKKRDEW